MKDAVVGACGAGAHGSRRSEAAARLDAAQGEHAAAIALKAVPGIGAEIVPF
jgi:hypothetical protein